MIGDIMCNDVRGQDPRPARRCVQAKLVYVLYMYILVNVLELILFQTTARCTSQLKICRDVTKMSQQIIIDIVHLTHHWQYMHRYNIPLASKESILLMWNIKSDSGWNGFIIKNEYNEFIMN